MRSVIKVDIPNKWAYGWYEARLKPNNYTIISQFNDKKKKKKIIPGGKISGATTYRVIPDIAL